MTVARRLDTPESRAFWGEPEPPPPKSKAARKRIAATKRETAARIDRCYDFDSCSWQPRDLFELVKKLLAEADELDGGAE